MHSPHSGGARGKETQQPCLVPTKRRLLTPAVVVVAAVVVGVVTGDGCIHRIDVEFILLVNIPKIITRPKLAQTRKRHFLRLF